jgi:hypothetical protein
MWATPEHDVRQLAQRSSANHSVVLLWNRRLHEVWISVCDRVSGEQLSAAVRPDRALDAFEHPFAYLAV